MQCLYVSQLPVLAAAGLCNGRIDTLHTMRIFHSLSRHDIINRPTKREYIRIAAQ